MSFLRAEISQTTKLASAASFSAGEVNNVTFLGGSGDDTFVIQGQENIIAGEQGDDNVMLSGDFNLALDDCGDNVIYSGGNNNTIAVQNGNNVIYSEGNCNEIMANNGNQYIESHGNYNLIDAGNGSHNILFTGNSNDAYFGNGDSTVYFFGDNNAIKGGNGNHNVKTLDWLIQNGQYTEYASFVESYANVSENSTLVQSIDVDSEVTDLATGNEGIGSASFKDESSTNTTQDVSVSSKTSYNGQTYTKDSLLNMLSSQERKIAENLDLTEQYSGTNRYIFAKGSKDGKVHLYDMKNNKACITSVTSGNKYLRIGNTNAIKTSDGVCYCFEGAGSKETTTTTTTTTTTVNTKASSGNYNDLVQYGEKIYAKQTAKGTIDTYMYSTQYDFGGINNSITLGNGTHSIYYTGSGQIQTENQCSNTNDASSIVHRGGINTDSYKVFDNLKRDVLYFVDNTKIIKESVDDVQEKITNIESGSVVTESPLIVDYNKDGQVSAKAGKGVDIDNNGKADGAAINGDKMLAMSDTNSNGKIDGTEVFGSQTVNPFTGEKINAANGFDALKEVAKSAYSKTGINCINNGNVDLQALKAALALIGVKLGFISDDNVTELEDLAHVKSINVENYTQQKQTGDVQHNQLGSYTSTDGKLYKTDDVWFKLS